MRICTKKNTRCKNFNDGRSMSNYSRFCKIEKCGAADSKYFGNPEQLDKDIQQHKNDSNSYKDRIKSLLLENPSKLKENYHVFIEVLTDAKKEFDL